MANSNMNERQMIVDWFETDFKKSISQTTRVERLGGDKVNYTFSVVNTAGYDFDSFSFKVEILNKADGSSLGSSVIEAGRWKSGEKKNFQSRISIPEGVTGISFVAYAESISYEGEPAVKKSVVDEISDMGQELGDFVSNVDASGVFGELFGTGGMPGGTTTTTTTTTTSSVGGTTTSTTKTTKTTVKASSGTIDASAPAEKPHKTVNTTKTTTRTRTRSASRPAVNYADRKLQKKLQKKRQGKSGWTVTAVVFAVMFGLAAFGVEYSYNPSEFISYVVAASGFVILAIVLKMVNNSKAKRIRFYEAMVDAKGNTVIFDMATKINRPVAKVADDLQEMIVAGFWPEAFVDYEDGLIVMTENGEPIVPISDTVAANKKSKRKMARDLGKVPNSIADLIIMTDDAEVKNKLKELDAITDKIDLRVKERPELGDKVKEFTERFYPEVVRLTDEYNEKIANLEAADNIEDKPVTEIHASQASLADQARDIKKQLIKLIDSVIEASENLLERLHEDDIMDITTDIAALKTTIASKGLLDSDFDIK